MAGCERVVQQAPCLWQLSQKLRMDRGVYPLLLIPEIVGIRGSSQPSTYFSLTNFKRMGNLYNFKIFLFNYFFSVVFEQAQRVYALTTFYGRNLFNTAVS